MKLIGINKIKNWRIRSQIALIQIITTFVTLIIIGICLMASYCYIIRLLQTDAQIKLSMTIIYQQTNLLLSQYSSSVFNKISSGLDSLDVIKQFSNLADEKNIYFSYDVEQTLNNIYDDENVIYKAEYGYGLFNCSQQNHIDYQSNQHLIQISNLLTQVLLSKIDQVIYFASVQPNCLFSTNPGHYYGDYVPSSRAWYQNHLQQFTKEKKFILTEPYLNIFGGIYITGTASVMKQNTLIGIAAIDYNFSEINQFSTNDMQLLIIDSTGKIIICSQYNYSSNEILYLSDSQLFGFSQQQIQQIISYNGELDSSCKNQMQNTLCLNDQQNILWYIRKMQIGPYYALIIFNEKAYQNYEDILEATIKRIRSCAIFWVAISFMGTISFCLGCYIISFFILQAPIERMINSFGQFIKQDYKQYNYNYIIFEENITDSLDKLAYSFYRLLNNSCIQIKSNSKKQRNLVDNQEPDFPLNYYKNCQILSEDILFQLHTTPTVSLKLITENYPSFSSLQNNSSNARII